MMTLEGAVSAAIMALGLGAGVILTTIIRGVL